MASIPECVGGSCDKPSTVRCEQCAACYCTQCSDTLHGILPGGKDHLRTALGPVEPPAPPVDADSNSAPHEPDVAKTTESESARNDSDGSTTSSTRGNSRRKSLAMKTTESDAGKNDSDGSTSSTRMNRRKSKSLRLRSRPLSRPGKGTLKRADSKTRLREASDAKESKADEKEADKDKSDKTQSKLRPRSVKSSGYGVKSSGYGRRKPKDADQKEMFKQRISIADKRKAKEAKRIGPLTSRLQQKKPRPKRAPRPDKPKTPRKAVEIDDASKKKATAASANLARAAGQINTKNMEAQLSKILQDISSLMNIFDTRCAAIEKNVDSMRADLDEKLTETKEDLKDDFETQLGELQEILQEELDARLGDMETSQNDINEQLEEQVNEMQDIFEEQLSGASDAIFARAEERMEELGEDLTQKLAVVSRSNEDAATLSQTLEEQMGALKRRVTAVQSLTEQTKEKVEVNAREAKEAAAKEAASHKGHARTSSDSHHKLVAAASHAYKINTMPKQTRARASSLAQPMAYTRMSASNVKPLQPLSNSNNGMQQPLKLPFGTPLTRRARSHTHTAPPMVQTRASSPQPASPQPTSPVFEKAVDVWQGIGFDKLTPENTSKTHDEKPILLNTGRKRGS